MPNWEEFAYHVARAQGMVSVQADCTMDEALMMMMERSQVQHQTVTEIAARSCSRVGSGSGCSVLRSSVEPDLAFNHLFGKRIQGHVELTR